MKRIVLASLLALSCLLPAQAKAADEIVVNGSTTVLPIMQKVSEAYMAANPNVQIALSGGGSGNGIKALLDGLANIAMSSRDIKGSEKELAAKKGINPVRTAVAVDALVPVVNPKNPITELSLSQLKDIYTGKITNWKEVGGADANIVVVSRDTSSGTYETWEELVMKKAKVMPKALLQASNGAVEQVVAKNPNAIGTWASATSPRASRACTSARLRLPPKPRFPRNGPSAANCMCSPTASPPALPVRS